MQVYWLDVEYIAVASAAFRAGQSLTALLYVEHSCQEQGGRLDAGSAQLLDEVMTRPRAPFTACQGMPSAPAPTVVPRA